jgi:hypothetical protein
MTAATKRLCSVESCFSEVSGIPCPTTAACPAQFLTYPHKAGSRKAHFGAPLRNNREHHARAGAGEQAKHRRVEVKVPPRSPRGGKGVAGPSPEALLPLPVRARSGRPTRCVRAWRLARGDGAVFELAPRALATGARVGARQVGAPPYGCMGAACGASRCSRKWASNSVAASGLA